MKIYIAFFLTFAKLLLSLLSSIALLGVEPFFGLTFYEEETRKNISNENFIATKKIEEAVKAQAVYC